MVALVSATTGMRTYVWTQGIVESILKGVLRNQKCLISAPFFFLSYKTAMYSTVQVKLIHIINQVKCGKRDAVYKMDWKKVALFWTMCS